MIEVVYKDEKKKAVGNQEFFHIPRNIRQIGEVEGDYKIYIEDYAYQFLNRLAQKMAGGQIAILLGKYNWSEGTNYIFIKSALQMQVMDADTNRIIVQTADWNEAGEKIEKLFPGQEIVGWYFTMPECDARVTEAIYRVHLHYFGGNDKVLFMQDPVDEEETFYYYDNGKMQPVSGYYLYYERNETMQEYLIEESGGRTKTDGDEVDDSAVQDFRQIIFKKKMKEDGGQEQTSKWVLAMGAAAAVMVLVVGSHFLSDYNTLKATPGTVKNITAQVEDVIGEGVQMGKELSKKDESISDDKENSTVGVTPGAKEEINEVIQSSPTVGAEDGKEDTVVDMPDGTTDTPEQEKGTTDQTQDTVLEKSERDGNSTDGMTNPETENFGMPSSETGSTGTENYVTEENGNESTKIENTAGSVNAATAKSYVIQGGDTLNRISEVIYGNTDMVNNICQLNGITPETTIYPGETILLP